MFRSKTLFILGAGASCEVGLPTGEGLKKVIAEKINIRFDNGITQSSGDSEIMEALRTVSRQNSLSNTSSYLQSARLLRHALPIAISIDNLLEAHKGDEKVELCGKLGIVKCIQESERNSKLYSKPSSEDRLDISRILGTWYPEFSKVLTEGVAKDELGEIFSNVSFISFNYDRCIEHAIFKSIETYYGLSEAEAKVILSKLKVHHPYGKIGRLAWQEGSAPVQEFGKDRIDLLKISKEIKTFNEQVHDKDEMSALREAFYEAEVIVFLGFAFHKQNLELLKPGKSCLAKRVFATAYGFSMSDCKVIEDDLKSVLQQKPTDFTYIEIRNDLKCVDLFNEYRRSLTV